MILFSYGCSIAAGEECEAWDYVGLSEKEYFDLCVNNNYTGMGNMMTQHFAEMKFPTSLYDWCYERSYGKFLADKLGAAFTGRAILGQGNLASVRQCHIDILQGKIGAKDIVLFGLTDNYRFSYFNREQTPINVSNIKWAAKKDNYVKEFMEKAATRVNVTIDEMPALYGLLQTCKEKDITLYFTRNLDCLYIDECDWQQTLKELERIPESPHGDHGFILDGLVKMRQELFEHTIDPENTFYDCIRHWQFPGNIPIELAKKLMPDIIKGEASYDNSRLLYAPPMHKPTTWEEYQMDNCYYYGHPKKEMHQKYAEHLWDIIRDIKPKPPSYYFERFGEKHPREMNEYNFSEESGSLPYVHWKTFGQGQDPFIYD
tara:strand:- start:398 stop:1516 length:1119 start_codon:yes stop_codon:yes gene_type:complete